MLNARLAMARVERRDNMLIYVSHEYGGKQENYDRAKRIVHDLQIARKKIALSAL